MGRRRPNFQVDPYAAKMLLARHQKQVGQAERIWKTFNDRPRDQDFFTMVSWPTDQIEIGKGTGIGYRSDKWQPRGVTKDYIHRHDKPRPRVIIQRPNRRDNPELADWPAAKNPLPRPRTFVFALLGFALDYEYLVPGGMIEQIDWKDDESKLPFLARATHNRHLLVIQPQDGGWPVLVYGPKLIVTAHGIEH